MNLQPYIQANHLFDKDSILIVGVSGGKDSMALLHWLFTHNYQIIAAHVNYNLRKESQKETDCVKQFCDKNNIPFELLEINPEDTPEANIQEWARDVRYDFFKKLQSKYGKESKIVIAHHLQDHLETFLLKFLKARMFTSLTGMNQSSSIVRPMLETSVEEIIDYNETHSINYIEDSSNSHPKYLRNRIRRTLLSDISKLMDNYPLQLKSSLNQLIDYEHIKVQYLEKLEEENVVHKNNLIVCNLNDLDQIVAQHLIHQLLLKLDINEHPARILEMFTSKTGAKWKLGDVEVLKDRNQLLIRSNHILNKVNQNVHSTGIFKTSIGELHIKKVDRLRQADSNVIYIPYNRVGLEREGFTIRNYNSDDKIAPYGMGGKHKKVSKILKDKKIDRFSKENVLVLIDNSTKDLVWLVGMVHSEKYKVINSTNEILEISWFANDLI